MAKTQKARGLETASKIASKFSAATISSAGYIVLDAPNIWGIPSEWYPVFVRPCPERPRHGFLESYIVYDKTSLMERLDETFVEMRKAGEPRGERKTSLLRSQSTGR